MIHPAALALVGLRGSGKSTLGAAVAARLGWPFADTDGELAAAAGVAGAGELLAAVGEVEFRRRERDVVLRCLSDPGPRVVALGGGAVLDDGVRARLRQPQVFTVWLEASDAVLVERLGRGPLRPPLSDLPPEAEVAALRTRREAAYREVSDLRLWTFPANVDACCETVLATMRAQGLGG